MLGLCTLLLTLIGKSVLWVERCENGACDDDFLDTSFLGLLDGVTQPVNCALITHQ